MVGLTLYLFTPLTIQYCNSKRDHCCSNQVCLSHHDRYRYGIILQNKRWHTGSQMVLVQLTYLLVKVPLLDGVLFPWHYCNIDPSKSYGHTYSHKDPKNATPGRVTCTYDVTHSHSGWRDAEYKTCTECQNPIPAHSPRVGWDVDTIPGVVSKTMLL